MPQITQTANQPAQLGFFPDEIPEQTASSGSEKEYTTPKKPDSQITRICRCCGQLAKNMVFMHGNIRLKDGPKLWDWFIKFNDFQSTTLNLHHHAHICPICLTKLIQAYKFHQQCLMAEKVFQVEAARPVAVRLKTVICEFCKKRIPAVFQDRHCQARRRLLEKNVELLKTEWPIKVGGMSDDCLEVVKANNKVIARRRVPANSARPRKSRAVVKKPDAQDNSSHFCERCGLMIPSGSLSLHNRRHHQRHYPRKYRTNVVPCKICKKPFPIDFVRMHIKRMHNPNGKTQLCTICGDTFREAKQLKFHILKHSSE
jgi:hypothetical protein